MIRRGGDFSLPDIVAWIYVSKMHLQRITAFNWCEVSVLQQQGNHPERVSQITSLKVVFNQVIITTDDYKDIYIWKLQVVGHRSRVLTIRQLSTFSKNQNEESFWYITNIEKIRMKRVQAHENIWHVTNIEQFRTKWVQVHGKLVFGLSLVISGLCTG